MDLALEFGSLPIIGVGHSAGGLMHMIKEVLFERSYSNAGNVFISFNNKGVKEAIPMFEQVVKPGLERVVEMVGEERVGGSLGRWGDVLDRVERGIVGSPFTPTAVVEDLMPIFRDLRSCVEQVNPLVEEVGRDGVVEFRPKPEEVKRAVELRYDVYDTLVVKFRNDSIDESEGLFERLNKGVSRNGNQIRLLDLEGNHVTPLVQGLPNVGGDIVGLFWRDPIERFVTREVRALVGVVDEWITKGITSGRL